MSLMKSVSGVRGIVGESLTPEIIIDLVSAFAELTNGEKVVLGGDSRVSGPMIKDLVKGTLAAHGYKVIDIGITPTPTVQLMTEQLKADGGIAITASHNPIQWNGLKFIGKDGMFLPENEIKELFSLEEKKDFSFASYKNLGQVKNYANGIQDHIEKILALDIIDKELIRSKKFTVIIDTVNGAGGPIMTRLLKSLGCQVIELNTEPTGIFAHTPEPVPVNLTDLGKAVKEHQADLGIAVDPDVDRCALVGEDGNPLGEEYTLAFAVKLILSKKLGPVVINMSTSRLSEDMVNYYNAILYRTKVGEIHVAKKMEEIGAVIGGEGNGGVILPEVHLGRDAPVAAALVLQLMAETGLSPLRLKEAFNPYVMIKEKENLADVDGEKVLEYFKNKYKKEKTDMLDGLKVDFAESWIHLRLSNTEPIIRIMAEAPTQEQCKKLIDDIKQEISSL